MEEVAREVKRDATWKKAQRDVMGGGGQKSRHAHDLKQLEDAVKWILPERPQKGTWPWQHFEFSPGRPVWDL